MNPTKRPLPSRATSLAFAVSAAAAILVGGAGPATAAPKEPLSYVALGDSFGSGYGAGSYVNGCGQSPFGLPGILDSKKQVDLVADGTCAGAKVATEPNGPIDLPEQVAGLVATGKLSPKTDLVTISAGGNDAGFAQIAGVCAGQSTAVCEQAIAGQSSAALPVLATNLKALYASIEVAAPCAEIVVTGYPHLFSPEFGTPTVLPVASQTAFNSATDAVNAVIRQQAEAAGFTYVDVVQKFEGHGLGSPDPWITFSGAPDDLHPTAKGYKSGYFPAVRSSVNLAQLQR